jgi:triacylglycerol esterase/lipase EstA (alpha/beta hydrolase family)
MVKKLILFVHGLGGSDETWGDFFSFIQNDSAFKGFDVESYNYRSQLLRTKNIVSLFSKMLATFIPQQRLPKIQDVADLLKTEIEVRYAHYDEIYLVTHSMGGLVARKYLYDMIKSNTPLQVKKLMLYAVPNNGSDWAKLSALYKHEQIEQLNRESDFIQHLNREVENIQLENAV